MLGIVNKRKKLVALPASTPKGGLSIWTCLTHFQKLKLRFSRGTSEFHIVEPSLPSLVLLLEGGSSRHCAGRTRPFVLQEKKTLHNKSTSFRSQMTNNGRNLDPTPPGNLSDNVLGLLDSPVGEQPSRRLRENPVRAVQQHQWHGEDQLVGNNGEIRKM